MDADRIETICRLICRVTGRDPDDRRVVWNPDGWIPTGDPEWMKHIPEAKEILHIANPEPADSALRTGVETLLAVWQEKVITACGCTNCQNAKDVVDGLTAVLEVKS